VAGGAERVDEFVEEDAVDAVVVGDQEAHGRRVTKHTKGEKRGSAEWGTGDEGPRTMELLTGATGR
jgi:hypothetical protein